MIMLGCLFLGKLWCSEPPPGSFYQSTSFDNIPDNGDRSQKPPLIDRLRAKLSPTLPNLDQLQQRTNPALNTTSNSSTQQH